MIIADPADCYDVYQFIYTPSVRNKQCKGIEQSDTTHTFTIQDYSSYEAVLDEFLVFLSYVYGDKVLEEQGWPTAIKGIRFAKENIE